MMMTPDDNREIKQAATCCLPPGDPVLPAGGCLFITWCSRPLPAVMLIMLAGIIVYGNSFHVPYVLDDLSSITQYAEIRSLDNFLNISGPEKLPRPNRFVGYLTFALNYHFGGLDVTGYHAVNLLIHLSAGLLVYRLGLLTFRTPFLRRSRLAPRAGLVALFAALLFVVHPVQTQAVTYIVQRLTSLATLFYLLAVVLYVTARLKSVGQAASGKRQAMDDRRQNGRTGFGLVPWTSNSGSVLLLGGAVLAAVLAMKTKEISFTLPLAILLYELFFFQGAWKRRLLYLLPVLATLPIVPLTVLTGSESIGESTGDFLSDAGEQTRAHTSMSRLDYLFTQFRVIVTYLRLLVLPVNQNLDYDYPVYTAFFSPAVFLSLLLLAAIFALAVYLYRQSRQTAGGSQQTSSHDSTLSPGISASDPGLRATGLGTDPALRLISFGILWFFLALSVESSLVPIRDVIFEHRLYLPGFGAAAAFTVFFFLVAERFSLAIDARLPMMIMGLLVLSLSMAAYQRNHVWGDDIRLWADVVRKSPQKGRPHNELGVALENGGRRQEAIESFRRAIAVDPYHYRSYHNLGDLYLVSGQPKMALPLLEAAIRIKPDLEEAYVKLAATLVRSGQFGEAASFLERHLDRIAENGEARFYLGAAYVFLGNRDAAQRELTIVSRLDPVLASDLSGLLGMGGRMTK